MRFATTAAALVALASSAAATLTINTPTTTLQECHNLALSWSGGTAPYYLYVYYANGSLAEDLNADATSETSGTWTINLASGTEVYFGVSDETGLTAVSGEVTISAGSSTTCATTTYFSVSGSTATAASDSSSTSAAAVATNTVSTSAAAASSSSSASAKSSSASSAKASSASTSASAAASASSAAASASASSSSSGASAIQGGILAAVAGAVFAMLA